MSDTYGEHSPSLGAQIVMYMTIMMLLAALFVGGAALVRPQVNELSGQMGQAAANNVRLVMGGGGSPNPLLPPKCDELKYGCEIDAAVESEDIYVKIRSGNNVVAEADLAKVNVMDNEAVVHALRTKPELLNTELGQTGRAWIGHIRTVRYLQKQGFGEAAWKNSDLVLRQYKPGAIRVFNDGTGWGPSLWARLEPWQKIYTDGVTYIYYP